MVKNWAPTLRLVIAFRRESSASLLIVVPFGWRSDVGMARTKGANWESARGGRVKFAQYKKKRSHF